MRKDAGLDLTDRIALTLPEADADLLEHAEWIGRETLALSVDVGDVERAGDRESVTGPVRVGLVGMWPARRTRLSSRPSRRSDAVSLVAVADLDACSLRGARPRRSGVRHSRRPPCGRRRGAARPRPRASRLTSRTPVQRAQPASRRSSRSLRLGPPPRRSRSSGSSPPAWVGFNRRFEPAITTMRAQFATAPPAVLELELSILPSAWGALDGSEAALLDLGPHVVDLALWLTGCTPSASACPSMRPRGTPRSSSTSETYARACASPTSEPGVSASSRGTARGRTVASLERGGLARRVVDECAAGGRGRSSARSRRNWQLLLEPFAGRLSDPRLASAARRRRSDEGARRCGRRPREASGWSCERTEVTVLALIGLDATPTALLDELAAEGLMPRISELRQAASEPRAHARLPRSSRREPSRRSGAVSRSATTGSTIRSSGTRRRSGCATSTRSPLRRWCGIASRRRAGRCSSSMPTRRRHPSRRTGSSSVAGSSRTGSCCGRARRRRRPSGPGSVGSGARSARRRSSVSRTSESPTARGDARRRPSPRRRPRRCDAARRSGPISSWSRFPPSTLQVTSSGIRRPLSTGSRPPPRASFEPRCATSSSRQIRRSAGSRRASRRQ